MPTPVHTLVLHSGSSLPLELSSRLQEGAPAAPWLRFVGADAVLPVGDATAALDAAGLARTIGDREVSHYRLHLDGAAPEGRSADAVLSAAVLLRWLAEETEEHARLAEPGRRRIAAQSAVILTGSAALSSERRGLHFAPVQELEHKLAGLGRWLEGWPDRCVVILMLAPKQDLEVAPVQAALAALRARCDLRLVTVERVADVADAAAEALLEALDRDLEEAQVHQALALAEALDTHRKLLAASRKEIEDALFRLGSQGRRIEDLVFEQRAGKMTLCAEASGGWLAVDEGRVRRLAPGGAGLQEVAGLEALRGVEVLTEGDQDVYLARTGPYGTKVSLFKFTPGGRWEVEGRPLDCPDGVVALQRHQRWAVGRGSRLYLWDLHAQHDDPHDLHHPYQPTTGGLLALDVHSGGNTFALLGAHQDGIWLYDVEVRGPGLGAFFWPFNEVGLRPARAVQPLRLDQGWLLATLHEPGPDETAFQLSIWRLEALIKDERRFVRSIQLALPGVDHQLTSVVLCWSNPGHLVVGVGPERGSRAPALWQVNLTGGRGEPVRVSDLSRLALQPMHRLVQVVANRAGTHVALLDNRAQVQIVDLKSGAEGLHRLRPSRLERSLEGEVVWTTRAWSLGKDQERGADEARALTETMRPLKKLLSDWLTSDSELLRLAARGATDGPLQPLFQELNTAYKEHDLAAIRGVEQGLERIAASLRRGERPATVASVGPGQDPEPWLRQVRGDVAGLQALLSRPVGHELALGLLRDRMGAQFRSMLCELPAKEVQAMVDWRLSQPPSGEPVVWERQPDLCPSLALAYEDIRRRLVGLGFVVEHPALARGERP